LRTALLMCVVDHQAPQQHIGRIKRAARYRAWNFWIKQHCEADRPVGSIDCAQPAARIEKTFSNGGRVRRHVTALLLVTRKLMTWRTVAKVISRN
jgi:hypothetical protein